MAKKITNEIIQQMLELYEEFGTYSAVSKKLGISASTVSKYIKEQNSCKTFTTYRGPTPADTPPEKDFIIGFGFLSTSEKQSYQQWLKEF